MTSNNLKNEKTLSNGMRFVLDMNALVSFEDVTGKNALTFLNSGNEPTMKDLRALTYSGLLKHNPTITLEQVGDILSENMGLIQEILNGPSLDDEIDTGKREQGKPQVTPTPRKRK